MASGGKLAAADRDAALARIRSTTELGALADCDLVVEAIIEDYEAKAALLRELDGICREDAILATNTSSISVTWIAAASKHPGRVIGLHFFNPVPVMQLIEVIRAMQTADAVCDAVLALSEALGKTARVSKDSYG